MQTISIIWNNWC